MSKVTALKDHIFEKKSPSEKIIYHKNRDLWKQTFSSNISENGSFLYTIGQWGHGTHTNWAINWVPLNTSAKNEDLKFDSSIQPLNVMHIYGSINDVIEDFGESVLHFLYSNVP